MRWGRWSVMALVPVVAASIGVGAQRGLAAAPCTDGADSAIRFALPVEGEQATGFYALPASPPKGLVVFSHGYGHSSFSWQARLRWAAAELGVVAVAMDGRGLTFLAEEKAPGIPETRGWPVQAAAEDGIAAARHFTATCPAFPVSVNFGVSMGGHTSGLMASSPDIVPVDGLEPLFDYWFDVEGVVDFAEIYALARAASAIVPTAANAAEDIEAEMGGPIEARPTEYFGASAVHPARVATMKANGLRGVVVVHGVDDGLVPISQPHELLAQLDLIALPAEAYIVTSKDGETERETTATGTFLNNLDDEYRSPAAGHASEMSTTHIVMKVAMARLAALFADQPRVCISYQVVDGQAGTTPALAPDCV